MSEAEEQTKDLVVLEPVGSAHKKPLWKRWMFIASVCLLVWALPLCFSNTRAYWIELNTTSFTGALDLAFKETPWGLVITGLLWCIGILREHWHHWRVQVRLEIRKVVAALKVPLGACLAFFLIHLCFVTPGKMNLTLKDRIAVLDTENQKLKESAEPQKIDITGKLETEDRELREMTVPLLTSQIEQLKAETQRLQDEFDPANEVLLSVTAVAKFDVLTDKESDLIYLNFLRDRLLEAKRLYGGRIGIPQLAFHRSNDIGLNPVLTLYCSEGIVMLNPSNSRLPQTNSVHIWFVQGHPLIARGNLPKDAPVSEFDKLDAIRMITFFGVGVATNYPPQIIGGELEVTLNSRMLRRYEIPIQQKHAGGIKYATADTNAIHVLIE